MKIAIKEEKNLYKWQNQVTVNNAKCRVCSKGFQYHRHVDGKRLKEVGICSDCDFWMEKFTMRDDASVARINGVHYIVGNELTMDLDSTKSFDDILEEFEKNNKSRPGLGMGGRVCAIRFYDGRTVFTNDLWGQGTIPTRFKHILVNNAEFIEKA